MSNDNSDEYRRARDLLAGFDPASVISASFAGQRCAECQRPIDAADGEFLSLGDDQRFHVECFNCAHCAKSLGTTFLSRDGKRYHQNCYRDHLAPRCRQCGQPMDGTKTLAVLADGTKIHQECLKCGRCGQQLTDKFSQGDGGQLYHKECYAELFAPKCRGCRKAIMPQSQYVEVKGSQFHVECFKCMGCQKVLASGGFAVPRDGVYLCGPCTRSGATPAPLPASTSGTNLSQSISNVALNNTSNTAPVQSSRAAARPFPSSKAPAVETAGGASQSISQSASSFSAKQPSGTLAPANSQNMLVASAPSVKAATALPFSKSATADTAAKPLPSSASFDTKPPGTLAPANSQSLLAKSEATKASQPFVKPFAPAATGTLPTSLSASFNAKAGTMAPANSNNSLAEKSIGAGKVDAKSAVSNQQSILSSSSANVKSGTLAPANSTNTLAPAPIAAKMAVKTVANNQQAVLAGAPKVAQTVPSATSSSSQLNSIQNSIDNLSIPPPAPLNLNALDTQSSNTSDLMARLNDQLQKINTDVPVPIDTKLKNANLPPASKAAVEFQQQQRQQSVAPSRNLAAKTLSQSPGNSASSSNDNLASAPVSAASTVRLPRAKTEDTSSRTKLAISELPINVPPPPAPIAIAVPSSRSKTLKAQSPLVNETTHSNVMNTSEDSQCAADSSFDGPSMTNAPPPPPPPPIASAPTSALPSPALSRSNTTPDYRKSPSQLLKSPESRKDLMEEIRSNSKNNLRKVATLKKKDMSSPGFLRDSSRGGSLGDMGAVLRPSSSNRKLSDEEFISSPTTPLFARELMSVLAQKRLAVSLESAPDKNEEDDADWDD